MYLIFIYILLYLYFSILKILELFSFKYHYIILLYIKYLNYICTCLYIIIFKFFSIFENYKNPEIIIYIGIYLNKIFLKIRGKKFFGKFFFVQKKFFLICFIIIISYYARPLIFLKNFF